jgi:anti-sigma B factor antagonist
MDTPSPAPFQVRVSADGDNVTLHLVGDLDLTAAENFRACVEGAVESNGGAVVVDLGDLAFIDSTGISALLVMRRHLEGQGRKLRVANVSAGAARVFELTGLTAVFTDGDGDIDVSADPT